MVDACEVGERLNDGFRLTFSFLTAKGHEGTRSRTVSRGPNQGWKRVWLWIEVELDDRDGKGERGVISPMGHRAPPFRVCGRAGDCGVRTGFHR